VVTGENTAKVNQMNRNRIFLLLSAVFAASSPLTFNEINIFENNSNSFPGWPSTYENKLLVKIGLTEKEKLFEEGFPGKIERFTDGSRELIIRWIDYPTRKLHSAARCFEGIGYKIKPLPIHLNKQNVEMSCFNAQKHSQILFVCEYILASSGDSWSDTSSWYWGALTSESSKGWMSYVVAEKK